MLLPDNIHPELSILNIGAAVSLGLSGKSKRRVFGSQSLSAAMWI